jgi:dihydroorotate dehydrogenase
MDFREGEAGLFFIFATMYQLIRKLLFHFDAELVHGFSMRILKNTCAIPVNQYFLEKWLSPGQHPVQLWGLTFRNPVGLGAGFDKNAKYLRELDTLGFGFVEVGTVTPVPQPGNDKPRLFRLPQERALINRMGFNNEGVDAAVKRIKKWRSQFPHSRMLVGGNIGKNKTTPNDEAWQDYENCFTAMHDVVDYFVVNVSSPNTPGLRELQEKESLRKILSGLQRLNRQKKNPRPILLKIAPDLTIGQLDDIASLALELSLDGLVATNTTISREGLSPASLTMAEQYGAGGLSGEPLKNRSTDVIRYLHEKTNNRIPIIGSGGIFTGADAKEKMAAGASLVQVWTGFIYVGPNIVSKILKDF